MAAILDLKYGPEQWYELLKSMLWSAL